MTAYFPALAIGGQTYDFTHLEPFTFTISSQLAKRDLRVHVTFSNHCFTQGYDAVTHPAGEPIIPDGKRQRTFCPHSLSAISEPTGRYFAKTDASKSQGMGNVGRA